LRGEGCEFVVLLDLQGLGSLTTIWAHLSDI
jgi:hypothetical protein